MCDGGVRACLTRSTTLPLCVPASMVKDKRPTGGEVENEGDKRKQLVEVFALAALADAPGVVDYFGAFIEDDRLYMQLELCEGNVDCDDVPVATAARPVWVAEFVAQVAAALACMHARGVVHHKKTLGLDWKSDEGRDILRKLVEDADVLIENFRVGALSKYGLGYDELRDEFPALVYCSITGFGQSGPLAPRAGYDFLVQAMGGLMSVTGERDGTPGAGPQKVGVAVTDLLTGLYTTIGALSGLARKERCALERGER